MSTDLSVIISYHSAIDIHEHLDNLNYHLSRFNGDMYYINNDMYCSSKLQELKSKYGHDDGVVFDEFNSSSYFADEMDVKTDYVMTCTY